MATATKNIKSTEEVPRVSHKQFIEDYRDADHSGSISRITTPDPMELLDAANECRHGHLPHDPKKDPGCNCWVAPLMDTLTTEQRKAKQRTKRLVEDLTL